MITNLLFIQQIYDTVHQILYEFTFHVKHGLNFF